MVDEVSMVPGKLWERLAQLKRLSKATFVLVGDHRQCAPPEEREPGWDADDYFDHPAVKWLADYRRVTLTQMHRYDRDLWDLSERNDPVEIRACAGCTEHPLAISRLNMTALHVKDVWMRRLRPAERVQGTTAASTPCRPLPRSSWPLGSGSWCMAWTRAWSTACGPAAASTARRSTSSTTSCCRPTASRSRSPRA